jgi:hypothetical protein
MRWDALIQVLVKNGDGSTSVHRGTGGNSAEQTVTLIYHLTVILQKSLQ